MVYSKAFHCQWFVPAVHNKEMTVIPSIYTANSHCNNVLFPALGHFKDGRILHAIISISPHSLEAVHMPVWVWTTCRTSTIANSKLSNTAYTAGECYNRKHQHWQQPTMTSEPSTVVQTCMLAAPGNLRDFASQQCHTSLSCIVSLRVQALTQRGPRDFGYFPHEPNTPQHSSTILYTAVTKLHSSFH